MNRAMILTLLNQHRDEFLNRFGAKHLALFGSAARDELRDDSDIDVLVDFDGPATFDRYMDLKFYLEALVARPVDLVTRDAVKPRMRPIIERDLIDVA
jgi:predicted nucleotidyltransferase